MVCVFLGSEWFPVVRDSGARHLIWGSSRKICKSALTLLPFGKKYLRGCPGNSMPQKRSACGNHLLPETRSLRYLIIRVLTCGA